MKYKRKRKNRQILGPFKRPEDVVINSKVTVIQMVVGALRLGKETAVTGVQMNNPTGCGSKIRNILL